MHHIDVSVRLNCVPSKAKYKKYLFWVWFQIWHMMYHCCFTYTSIFQKFFQFVMLCKELQNIRIIYIIITIWKVYIFKSYSRHKAKQILFEQSTRIDILRNSWFYCITVPQVQRPLQTETFDKIRESFLREFCFYSLTKVYVLQTFE